MPLNAPRARPLLLLAASLSACALPAGCARPAGPLFEPASPALAWPPPPDTPRIYWIGQFAGSADLKAGQSFGQRLNAALFGREPQEVFIAPMAVCTDGADRVFVADAGARLVHVLDLRTRRYEQWRPPPGELPLVQPVALAWAPPGRLLVSDAVGRAIAVFGPAGEFRGHLGIAGMFVRPCGIAVDPPRQRILVADPGAHQIVVLAPDGSLIQRVGERGPEPGQFNFPTFVAASGDGHIFVSDSLNFRVQVLAPDLSPLRTIGQKGDMPGYFSQPKGLAVSPAGHLLVIDANFEAVQVFTADGDLLMTFGREGKGPGEFWLPAGIFAAPDNRVWIADNYNKRLQVFEYRHTEGPP